MTAVLLTPLTGQFFDNNGNPLSGGLVYSYIAGTTTPQPTYTNATGTTPATNPVVLNSAGRADIWGSGTYDFKITDSVGNIIDTIASVTAIFGSGDMTKAIYDPANVSQQLLGTSAVQTVTNKSLVDSSTFIVDEGDNTKKLAFQCSGITTGTTRTLTVPDASGTIALTSGVVFTKSFTSTDQTITSAGALTIPHGLGVAPTLLQAYLVCQTDELGYTAGQVVPVNNAFNDQTASCIIDSTNILVRYGASGGAFALTRADTGAGAGITNTNWKYRVRVWA